MENADFDVMSLNRHPVNLECIRYNNSKKKPSALCSRDDDDNRFSTKAVSRLRVY